MKSHLETGHTGELEAARFLEKKGIRTVQRNFRCALGEIDLICRHKETLVFVEVKTRFSTVFGDGSEAINKRKRDKIQKTALFYLKSKKLSDVPIRFDAVTILSSDPIQFNHIENAF